jgi:hypothetical protein
VTKTRIEPPRSALRRSLLLVIAAGAASWVAACGGGSEAAAEVDRGQIEQLLRDYLPKMGQAYETGDFAPLQGLAAEKEIAVLQKHIGDLWDQEGRLVEAELVDFVIEDVRRVSYSIALVTTLETWNLRVKPIGSEQVLSEVENQRNRVRYQLEREDDRWKVLSRNREATFE